MLDDGAVGREAKGPSVEMLARPGWIGKDYVAESPARSASWVASKVTAMAAT